MDAATNLVELKRVLDKVDQDIDVLKSRLQIREEGGDGASVDAMDNDDRAETVEPEGETGRSQSVMSARSTRGRKNARRSMSISSVDTSAPGRPPTKRQKRI